MRTRDAEMSPDRPARAHNWPAYGLALFLFVAGVGVTWLVAIRVGPHPGIGYSVGSAPVLSHPTELPSKMGLVYDGQDVSDAWLTTVTFVNTGTATLLRSHINEREKLRICPPNAAKGLDAYFADEAEEEAANASLPQYDNHEPQSQEGGPEILPQETVRDDADIVVDLQMLEPGQSLSVVVVHTGSAKGIEARGTIAGSPEVKLLSFTDRATDVNSRTSSIGWSVAGGTGLLLLIAVLIVFAKSREVGWAREWAEFRERAIQEVEVSYTRAANELERTRDAVAAHAARVAELTQRTAGSQAELAREREERKMESDRFSTRERDLRRSAAQLEEELDRLREATQGRLDQERRKAAVQAHRLGREYSEREASLSRERDEYRERLIAFMGSLEQRRQDAGDDDPFGDGDTSEDDDQDPFGDE